MRIAIYTGNLEERVHLLQYQLLGQLCQTLVAGYSQHQFLLVGNLELNINGSHNNVEEIPLQITGESSLIKGWWHNRKLAKAIGNWNADVIVNFSPATIIKTAAPVLGVFHSAYCEQFFAPKRVKKLSGKKIKALQGSKTLLIDNPADSAIIGTRAGLSPAKFKLLPPVTSDVFVPIDWPQKEAVKATWASEREYFLYHAAIKNNEAVLKLLKAFSAFKKRQQSNMQLLIAGAALNEALLEKLNSYKYRHDVHLYTNPSTILLAKLAGAAYAVILPPQFAPAWWILGAMKCQTAIIGCEAVNNALLNTDTAWIIEKFEPGQIGQGMKQLYTNEKLRSEKLANSALLANQCSTQQVAESLMQCIENPGS